MYYIHVCKVSGVQCQGKQQCYHFHLLLNRGQLLTLLHSERPKLYTILAFLSAIGLKERILLL